MLAWQPAQRIYTHRHLKYIWSAWCGFREYFNAALMSNLGQLLLGLSVKMLS
jgi:hypothetical protein